MVISLIFVICSAAWGAGIWYLIIRILLSLGGGLFVTLYDSVFFYITILIIWTVTGLLFANHLREQKLELLLFVCGITALLAFFVAAMFFLL